MPPDPGSCGGGWAGSPLVMVAPLVVASSSQTSRWPVRAWLAAAVKASRRCRETACCSRSGRPIHRRPAEGSHSGPAVARRQHAAEVSMVAWSGIGEGHRPPILVGEPGEDVALGLHGRRGRNPLAITLHPAEPQPLQQPCSCGVGQLQRWCWRNHRGPGDCSGSPGHRSLPAAAECHPGRSAASWPERADHPVPDGQPASQRLVARGPILAFTRVACLVGLGWLRRAPVNQGTPGTARRGGRRRRSWRCGGPVPRPAHRGGAAGWRPGPRPWARWVPGCPG